MAQVTLCIFLISSPFALFAFLLEKIHAPSDMPEKTLFFINLLGWNLLVAIFFIFAALFGLIASTLGSEKRNLKERGTKSLWSRAFDAITFIAFGVFFLLLISMVLKIGVLSENLGESILNLRNALKAL